MKKKKMPTSCKVCKVKKKLAELIPEDPQIEAVERWKQLRYKIDIIENTGHKDAKTVPLV